VSIRHTESRFRKPVFEFRHGKFGFAAC